MKNIIFIVNIGGDDDRNKPYHFSIKCWKKWADKNETQIELDEAEGWAKDLWISYDKK